jgi:hypothetical protein
MPVRSGVGRSLNKEFRLKKVMVRSSANILIISIAGA